LKNLGATDTVNEGFPVWIRFANLAFEVNKVIISQESLQRFINAVSPGAYTSITKVDFKALDQFMIKPLGVYGSKDEIVHLLRSIDVVDENT
jgi:hypothetical protein